MAGKGGEYNLVRSNFNALSKDIAQVVEAVASKAYEKNLISLNNHAKARSNRETGFDRASDLLSLLLTKIELNSDDFYTILGILRDIPTLGNSVRLLEPGQVPGQASASGQAPEQASGQASAVNAKLSDRPSNKEAVLALLPVVDEWKFIGTMLELPASQLNSIEKRCVKEKDMLLEMVADWLKTENANWGDLIAAVKSVDKKSAVDIEKKLSS